MKHFTSFFCTCLLFLLMSGGTAKAQDWNYYMTDGTENGTKTGLTSGYYILSVQGIHNEGLLYWSDTQKGSSNLLISTSAYSAKTNQLLDKTASSEDVAFIWYLDVNAVDNTFKIRSVKSGKFLSNTGVSGAAASDLNVPTVDENDASIATFTINYTHTQNNTTSEPGPIKIPESTGKDHFIVKLANEAYTNGSAFLHVTGTYSTSANTINEDWHLQYRGGFNRSFRIVAGNGVYSCAKIAFFKLSEAAAFTYDYKINGTSVKSEEKGAIIGDSYPALATMPDFCAATAPTGNVDQADHNQTKDITVTWSAPFQFSTTINNAHWYHMKFGNAQRFVVNTGANQAIPLAATDATHTTASTEQWAFVGNPFDGFKVYNRRKQGGTFGRLAASTTMLPTSGQRIGNDTEVTVHYGELAAGTTDIYDALTVTNNVTFDNSFFLCQHGETSKKMNWAASTDGSTSQRIAFWIGGQGNNSAFTVQELSLPSLNLTTIGDNTYGTYYIDYPIAVPNNVSVYTGDVDLENKRISMRLANEHIIPAETGVVLVGDNGEATTCTMTASNEAGTLAKGSLTGSLKPTNIYGYNDRYLVFGRNSEGQLGFYRPGESLESIPANKAFIEIPESQVQGLALSFEGGTHTGINLNDILAPEKQNEGTYYDLSGRRVSKPTKGCYIHNGKKIYIK